MVVTFTLKGLGNFVLIVALIVLVIFLIVMTSHLIKTLRHANNVMEDAEVISAIAKKRAQDVDGIIDDFSGSAKGIGKALRGNESFVQALSAVAKAVTSVIGIIKGSKDED
ncbi:MAG: hypothetical protein VZQ84_03490 [Anaerovoracaceae bacterium]|nr:hypothetical protein [Anaerovoracaceae bacterium]